MRVAVFCASANEVEPCYFREAGRLGKRIGELGWQLIYGGTNIGLMREVADATIRQGGEVTGIIPECIRDRGVAAGGLLVIAGGGVGRPVWAALAGALLLAGLGLPQVTAFSYFTNGVDTRTRGVDAVSSYILSMKPERR